MIEREGENLQCVRKIYIGARSLDHSFKSKLVERYIEKNNCDLIFASIGKRIRFQTDKNNINATFIVALIENRMK